MENWPFHLALSGLKGEGNTIFDLFHIPVFVGEKIDNNHPLNLEPLMSAIILTLELVSSSLKHDNTIKQPRCLKSKKDLRVPPQTHGH